VTDGRQRRPPDDYYETRNEHLSQGDIFRDVPLAYPLPADGIVIDEDDHGVRIFLSGPFTTGLALLVTPSCSMTAQRAEPGTYAHPVRTLVVIRAIDELVANEVFNDSKLGLIRSYDSLNNYMYLSENRELEIPESVALLYMPVTLHHEIIADQRVTQLTKVAAQQLQRKLAYFTTSMLIDREEFDPPMD